MQLPRHVPADAGLLFDKEVKKTLSAMKKFLQQLLL
jgi:hypothetical protein